jgi:hypothetical protein
LRLDAANVDDLEEGEELGVLVVQATGALALFRRKPFAAEWTCIVHWDACVPEASRSQLFVLVELGGRIEEVQCLWCPPPSELDRPLDIPMSRAPIWPERPALVADALGDAAGTFVGTGP